MSGDLIVLNHSLPVRHVPEQADHAPVADCPSMKSTLESELTPEAHGSHWIIIEDEKGIYDKDARITPTLPPAFFIDTYA